MLVLLVRFLFVLFATSVGYSNGQFFFAGLFDGSMPPWFGASLGFGVAVTLIAAEQAFRRRFTRSLVAFIIGLAAGLLLSGLLIEVLHLILQNQEFAKNLDVPVTLVATYLVLLTVLRNVDRWRIILPFVELHSENLEGGVLVVDIGMLGDTRLPGLLKTGFFTQRLLVHRAILSHWESEAASDDTYRQRLGRRALDGLTEIRALGLPPVEIDESEIPNSKDLTDTLIRLCRLEGARLLTSERDQARRAQAEGVQAVDINALAMVLAPQLKPGQQIEVLIAKPGEGRGQGIGFLDDGSMVVVGGAAESVGQTITCTIARLHTTGNGRMVFADMVA
jgi:uncharacterized protein YacL